MTSANWAGNYTYRASTVHRPTSVEDVQELVAAADHIKALGSRHSFNDVADSTGEQLSLEAMPTELDINRAANTVTVNAGARYGSFAEELHGAGFAVHNLASLPHISVAGAVATGTHGSGDRNGNLSAAVAGFELVTADGSLVTVRRGDADFEGTVVSLGALGVVTRVTLDIEPTFEVRQDVYENLAWSTLDEHFDEITSAAYSVSLFTNWSDRGINQVWLKSRTDAGPARGGEPTFLGATLATRQLHPLPDVAAESTTEQGGVPGPWWNRLSHFRLDFTPSNGEEIQTEYLVGRKDAVAAIAAIRALGPQIAPHLFISEIRTMKADHLWLSPAFGRDTVAIHFTWKREDAVQTLLPLIDAALAPFDARPHWGKVYEIDAHRFDELYPMLPEFRQLADRLDPSGKFRNDYLHRTIFTE
ncbi:MAG: FAD-binding protein [Lacisediminihabitans sp.]